MVTFGADAPTGTFLAAKFDIHAIWIVIFPASGTAAVTLQARGRQVDEASYDN